MRAPADLPEAREGRGNSATEMSHHDIAALAANMLTTALDKNIGLLRPDPNAANLSEKAQGSDLTVRYRVCRVASCHSAFHQNQT